MSRSGILALVAALLAALPGAAHADPTGVDVGDASNSKAVITSSDSELNSLGDFRANLTGAAEADVVGGSNGTFAFPINTTVYGLQYVRRPEDPRDWDSYCFIVRYSTTPIAEADDAQTGANNRYAFEMEKDYYDDAEAAHIQDVIAWEADKEAIDEENEQRAADGEPLRGYPPRPEPPTFPLEPCEDEPATIPDFVPAFDAAAELIRSIDPAQPTIAPGSGITGVEAYLETQRPLTVQEAARTLPDLGTDLSDPSNPAPVSGTVSFRGQGAFTVDWGDGTVEGPFEDPGVAYGEPGVAITHAYVDLGDRTVTVTDSWRVSMTVNFLGEEFIFTHRETFEPRSLTFPVAEVRSVRDR